MSNVAPNASMYRPRLGLRRALVRIFAAFCLLMMLTSLVVLIVLLVSVVQEGRPWLSLKLVQQAGSSRNPQNTGIRVALLGTLWIAALTALIAVPVGVSAAVYLEEYAKRNRFTRFIQLNIANLAGVPSVVYGILGLAIFVRAMTLQRSIISGALTMSLLALPVIIIAAREALAAVPNSIRLAAYALGATRWQVVRYHVLPAALPGIMTGVILSLSRAIGEATPLIIVGAVGFILDSPSSLLDAFTVLPIQIFNWSSHPMKAFTELAAAAIVVLLAALLSLNALAIGIRLRNQKDKLW